MMRMQRSSFFCVLFFFTTTATSASATSPAQVDLDPAPRVEGYTGYEHASCSGAEGSILFNIFGTPEQCGAICTGFGDECAGFVIAAGKAPGVRELQPGTLGVEEWPYGSCFLRRGPAPMNVVDFPLDCMVKNADGSYTKYEERNCWGNESDFFRGTAYGGGPFGVNPAADGDSDSAHRRRQDDDSDDSDDSDSHDATAVSTPPINYPWQIPTPQAESERLCEEFCDALGPQCTAVMRTPADGQCYFRSAAGVQPLVDWAVRCYLKD